MRSLCEVQVKQESHGFEGLVISILGLKQFSIWVLILQVIVSFVIKENLKFLQFL
jgi:hypothetical protein